jgi:CSLREA domain-containing protein
VWLITRPNAFSIALITVCLALVFTPADSSAATITVNSLADSGGTCPGADCTLRQAIAVSNSNDTINFGVTGTIQLTSAELSVNHNLTITGPSPNSLTITRATSANFRIFYFDNGTWTLSGVTISNGHDTVNGGGIYNGNGSLTVINCVISNNTANNAGGGIYNGVNLTVQDCTISGNVATNEGGGIYSGSGSLTVTRSTFDHNNALTNTGQPGGRALSLHNGGTFQNCTFYHPGFSSSLAIHQHGGTAIVRACTFLQSGIEMIGGTMHLGNTILSGSYLNSQPGFGTAISDGYNLSSDSASGVLTNTGDQPNTDPKLDPYGPQYYGGYTDTIALTYGSPAIDAGKSFGLSTDQTGNPRTYDNPGIANASGGDGTDIGAYEAPADPIEYGLVVNTTADHDGTCGSDCTLREAINRANSFVNPPNPAPEITFAPGLIGTITVGSELVVNARMNITGPGARNLALSGGGTSRILNLVANTNVTISGLTIRDGNYAPSQNQGETRQGGGVFNSSSVTFNDCAFVHNSITGASNSNSSGAGGSGQGGAIYNASTLILNGCTFSGNSATGAAGTAHANNNILGPGGNGGAGQGGAIYNKGFVIAHECTFNGNTATGGAGGAGNSPAKASGGDGKGGAIFDAGDANFTSVTISGNTGTGGLGYGFGFTRGTNGSGTGGVSAATASFAPTITNTILAGNIAHNGSAAPDADGAFDSFGFNLVGIANQSTGWLASGCIDLIGTASQPLDPKLGPLQDNGDQTDTMALLAGSPALDHGYSTDTTDQRGAPRVFDDPNLSTGTGCGNEADIGAFELQIATGTPTPTPTPNPMATPTPTSTPTPTPTPSSTTSTLANISTRLEVETGDNVLIGGFIVTGTQDKKVIVRAIGPSLPVTDALADPFLELHDGAGNLIASNDNWKDTQQAEIETTTIPPSNELESAIVATLPANSSAYTAIVRGVNDTTGVGLVEVYDLNTSVDSKLANISTRGLVQTGDNVMIGGFIVLGQSNQKVIVRAIGPSLPVANALADPTLELHNGNGDVIAFDDNWKDNQQSEIEATTIPPTNDLESAIVATLSPGNYTAIVRGVNDTTGVALVEVYALN